MVDIGDLIRAAREAAGAVPADQPIILTGQKDWASLLFISTLERR